MANFLPSEMDRLSIALPPQVTSKQQLPSSSQDDDDEVATVKVLPDVTLQIWASLLSRRGYQVLGTKLIRTTSDPTVLQTSEVLAEIQPGKSVLSVFKRTNSFAPAILEAESIGNSKQPFRRTVTCAGVFAKSVAPLPSTPEKNGGNSTFVDLDAPSGAAVTIFTGCRFRALGEAKTMTVKNAIELYGGQMVAADDEEVDFILVRLVRCVEPFY